MSEFAAKPETKKDVGLTKLLLSEEASNPRGIPTAKFIENVEDFLQGNSVEATLGAYQELYGKYKYMESHFEKSKSVYKQKIPDIEQTLDTVKLLIHQRDAGEAVHANYSLSDTVYAKAKVSVHTSALLSSWCFFYCGCSVWLLDRYQRGKSVSVDWCKHNGGVYI